MEETHWKGLEETGVGRKSIKYCKSSVFTITVSQPQKPGVGIRSFCQSLGMFSLTGGSRLVRSESYQRKKKITTSEAVIGKI